MKKKVCLFEQHLNSMRQNGSRSPFDIKTTYKPAVVSRVTRKNIHEPPHHSFTYSWIKKAPIENQRHRNYNKRALTSIFSVSPTKTSKNYFVRVESKSKRNMSMERSFSPANISTQNKSLSFFGYNAMSPKSGQKNIFLSSHPSQLKISPTKPSSTTKNIKSKAHASHMSFEKMISKYIASSTKYLDKKKISTSKSKEKNIDERENKTEESNISLVTVSSTNSNNRMRSIPRSIRSKPCLGGARSLQAEIDLLFGRKQNADEPAKSSKLGDEENKKRNSLLNKINKAVTKGINLFTKFNLFEEAETEEFDNPKHREYMEDVVHCEFITTKLSPHSKTKSIEKGSLSLLDKEFETEKSLKLSNSGISRPITEIDLPIISERQEIESLADSLIESSMYGNLKEKQHKPNPSKDNMSRRNASNTKSNKENLVISANEPTNSTNATKLTLFTIFDGHGGNQVSLKAKEILPKEIHSRLHMNSAENSIKSILIECFEKVDKELMTKIPNCDDIGSTCTLCFITKTKTNRIITVANLGDSHAYLVSNKKAVRLTSEHKCSNEEEFARLKEKSAIIYQNRMFGQLALTRAFCDRKHKPYGLLATPSITQQTIKEKPISQNAIIDNEIEYDLYLIIASDGIWDVTTEADLMRMFVESANAKTTKQLAKTLMDFAIDKGSTDNISLIVVKL